MAPAQQPPKASSNGPPGKWASKLSHKNRASKPITRTKDLLFSRVEVERLLFRVKPEDFDYTEVRRELENRSKSFMHQSLHPETLKQVAGGYCYNNLGAAQQRQLPRLVDVPDGPNRIDVVWDVPKDLATKIRKRRGRGDQVDLGNGWKASCIVPGEPRAIEVVATLPLDVDPGVLESFTREQHERNSTNFPFYLEQMTMKTLHGHETSEYNAVLRLDAGYTPPRTFLVAEGRVISIRGDNPVPPPLPAKKEAKTQQQQTRGEKPPHPVPPPGRSDTALQPHDQRDASEPGPSSPGKGKGWEQPHPPRGQTRVGRAAEEPQPRAAADGHPPPRGQVTGHTNGGGAEQKPLQPPKPPQRGQDAVMHPPSDQREEDDDAPLLSRRAARGGPLQHPALGSAVPQPPAQGSAEPQPPAQGSAAPQPPAQGSAAPQSPVAETPPPSRRVRWAEGVGHYDFKDGDDYSPGDYGYGEGEGGSSSSEDGSDGEAVEDTGRAACLARQRAFIADDSTAVASPCWPPRRPSAPDEAPEEWPTAQEAAVAVPNPKKTSRAPTNGPSPGPARGKARHTHPTPPS
jgi:hypothetical protein